MSGVLPVQTLNKSLINQIKIKNKVFFLVANAFRRVGPIAVRSDSALMLYISGLLAPLTLTLDLSSMDMSSE